jgi:hypothetical protein
MPQRHPLKFVRAGMLAASFGKHRNSAMHRLALRLKLVRSGLFVNPVTEKIFPAAIRTIPPLS